ncbi:hypothetical protein Q5M87_09630 [Brachyspira innocens]|uniref:Lipoprotein n=1 Tax=Brachyspira innocens TaxID=13264 RepID=A0ABT8Z0L1_9SPIR|nr:hypothetical protein [Brachyspira innocens]MDO6994266.1 hypothetical protein [Brachyspira innocens]MDO7020675.1 hypothetical protein [Brachyspira innocens]
MKKNVFYAFFIFLTIFMISACSNNSTGPNGSGNNNSGLVGTTWSSEYAGEGSGFWAAINFREGGKVSIGWCKSEKSAVNYAQNGGKNNVMGTYTINGDSGNIQSSKPYAQGDFTVNGNSITFKTGMKPTYNKK